MPAIEEIDAWLLDESGRERVEQMGQVDRPADVVKSGARIRPRCPGEFPAAFPYVG